MKYFVIKLHLLARISSNLNGIYAFYAKRNMLKAMFMHFKINKMKNSIAGCRKIAERRFKILILNVWRNTTARPTIPFAWYFFSCVSNSCSDARLFLASDKRDTPWPVFTNGIIVLSATAAAVTIAPCAVDRVPNKRSDSERWKGANDLGFATPTEKIIILNL